MGKLSKNLSKSKLSISFLVSALWSIKSCLLLRAYQLHLTAPLWTANHLTTMAPRIPITAIQRKLSTSRSSAWQRLFFFAIYPESFLTCMRFPWATTEKFVWMTLEDTTSNHLGWWFPATLRNSFWSWIQASISCSFAWFQKCFASKWSRWFSEDWLNYVKSNLKWLPWMIKLLSDRMKVCVYFQLP